MKASNNKSKFGNDYSFVKFIAGGGFGKTYLVSKNETNKEYVAKVPKLKDEESKNTYENEKKINEIVKKELNNPNIVEYIESRENEFIEIENEYKDFLIFEYCSKGELLGYVQLSGGFEEKVAKIIFKTILETVEKLHEIGIYHLDLKLENILIDKDFNIKIADFGLSKQKTTENDGIFKEAIGTTEYAPPQMFRKPKYYGDKADIFSLGANLFILVIGGRGFQDSRPQKNKYEKKTYYNLLQSNKEQYWEKMEKYVYDGKTFSKEFKDLFEKMVSYNEENRPDIKDLLKHKWFDEINNLTDEEKKKIVKEALEEKEIKVDDATKKEVNPKHKDGKNEAFNGETTFNDETEIRYEKNEKIFDKYIKINGDFNPIHFMNEYKNAMSDLYEIEKSKDNTLQFYIINKKDEENENDEENEEDERKFLQLGNDDEIQKELKVKVELIKINDGHLLLFNKFKGELVDFYNILRKLMEYAEDFI